MKIELIVIVLIVLFAVVYTFIVFEYDFGVMDYDQYMNNPPCEFKQLDDGYTQIPNCAKYKIKDIYLKNG